MTAPARKRLVITENMLRQALRVNVAMTTDGDGDLPIAHGHELGALAAARGLRDQALAVETEARNRIAGQGRGSLSEMLENAPASRTAPLEPSRESFPVQPDQKALAAPSEVPRNTVPRTVNEPLKIPHHAEFQPRKNGKFAGPPDLDALDKAIRASFEKAGR